MGSTGTGKSWLACALGHKACREGFSVLYRRAPRLFAELATARGEGRLPRMLAMLERTRLLIIDDWGPEPLTAEQRRDLLEIVEDRYEKGSLLITSQIPVTRWHELIGDPTIGDAILDRVVHRAHRIELKGPSLRKRHAVAAAIERANPVSPMTASATHQPPQSHCNALRNGNQAMPNATPGQPPLSNAERQARYRARLECRSRSRRSDIGVLSTGGPAYNDGTTPSPGCSPSSRIRRLVRRPAGRSPRYATARPSGDRRSRSR